MAATRLSGGGVVIMDKPTTDQVWAWLDEVPDPEIPVISLVDLGIIRGVEWQGDTLEIAVTPTYSGCPATSVINLDIVAALGAKGVDNVRLRQQIAPPWTTDWLSDKGREKLEKYGIAPPQAEGSSCPSRPSASIRGRIRSPAPRA